MREQVKLLEHKTDMRAEIVHIQPRRVDILAGHRDMARSDRLQAVDGAYQGRLARTGGTANHQHFALGNVFADAIQGMVVAIVFIDVVKGDHAAAFKTRAWRRSSQKAARDRLKQRIK